MTIKRIINKYMNNNDKLLIFIYVYNGVHGKGHRLFTYSKSLKEWNQAVKEWGFAQINEDNLSVDEDNVLTIHLPISIPMEDISRYEVFELTNIYKAFSYHVCAKTANELFSDIIFTSNYVECKCYAIDHISDCKWDSFSITDSSGIIVERFIN